MSDPVLRIQTNGARWLVQLWNARALVAPLADADLANIAGLPVFASTWEQLLAHLAPNDTWSPERRILAALGTLIRERIVSGKGWTPIAA